MRENRIIYDLLRRAYKRSVKKLSEANIEASIFKEDEYYTKKLEEADRKSKLIRNALANNRDLWGSTDIQLRNKENNYNLFEKEQDPVISKLSNLKEKYGKKFSNYFKKDNEMQKEREKINEYIEEIKYKLKNRKMKKEEYNYLFKNPENKILKDILKPQESTLEKRTLNFKFNLSI